MALETETLSQLVGVILMVAPSASDNHVENYSYPAVMLETHADCHVVAHSFNESQVQVRLTPTSPVTIAYAWCKPVYGGEGA